jgi:hypothetical protein
MVHHLAIFSFVALCLAGCGATPAASAPSRVIQAPIKRLDMPPGNYFGAAWIDERNVVAAWKSGGIGGEGQLVSIDPVTSGQKELPFAPDDEECWRAQEDRPTRLPDGRLGFIRECQPRQFRNDLSISWHRLWAVDLANDRRELIFDLGDPPRGNLYSISVRAGMQEAAVYIGTRLCDGVARGDRTGVSPISIPLTDDPNGPNLDEPFKLECADTINARDPVWSPDGRRLAVVASFDVKGREGLGRLDATWDLIVVTPEVGERKTLLRGLSEPSSVAWSGDGRWITLEDTQETGGGTTWLIDAASGRVMRLESNQRVTGLTWAPDSHALFGFVDPTPNGDVADFDAAPVIIELTHALPAP